MASGAAESTYKAAVLADSPSVYYRLDEASGTVATDSSTAHNNGTYGNGVTYGVTGGLADAPDSADSAIGLSGSVASPVTSTQNVAITGDSAWAIEGWYKSTSSTSQVLAAFGQGASEESAALTVQAQAKTAGAPSGNSILLDLYGSYVEWPGLTLNDGLWHHVVVGYAGGGSSSTPNFSAYLDGAALSGPTLSNVTFPLAMAAGPAQVGAFPADRYGDFSGSLDEVAIYPAALSAARVTDHYSAAGPSTGNLATDFQAAGSHSSVYHFGPWHFFEAPEAVSSNAAVDQTDTTTYAPLTQHPQPGCGSGGSEWTSATGSGALYSPAAVSCSTWHYPAGTVDLWPASSSEDVGVSWKAPSTGTVSITGSIWDNDPGVGSGSNGILWYVNHDSSELASGGFGNGGNQDLNTGAGTSTVTETGGASLQSVQVTAGDTISLLIDPNQNYYFDNTGVQFNITYDSYAQAVQADSPAAYYRFDDSAPAADLTDSSNSPLNGTYTSGVTLGQPGAATSLDDTAVTSPSSGGIGTVPSTAASLTGNGPRTFEVWEKSTSGGSSLTATCTGTSSDCQALASLGSGTISNGHLFQPSFSPHQVMLWEWGGAAYVNTPSNVNLDDGNWHQIAVSYDGAHSVTFYVDGQLIGTDSSTVDTPTPLSIDQSQVLIGNLASNMSLYSVPFVGSMDDMSIYPTQLSASTILAHYQVSPVSFTAPAVTTQPSPQTVTAGNSVSFTAAASGNPTPTVQWQVEPSGASSFTNASGPGATSSTYTFTASASDNGSKYQAVFTNSAGTTKSNAVLLTVDYAPAVTTQPSPQTVTAGSSVSFTAAASGNPTPTVQWQVEPSGASSFTNASGPGATSSTYTFTASASDNGSKYQAVFTNSAGTTTSNAALLTVNSPPPPPSPPPATSAPAVTTQPSSQTVSAGSPVTFTAAASGNPTPTVQWQVEPSGGSAFSNIPGATSGSYTFTPTASDNGNKYQAVFTNSAGTATSNAAALTVTPQAAPQPPASPAPTRAPAGYNEVAADGGLFSFGAAGFYGSLAGSPLSSPVVAAVDTPDHHGYWIVTKAGDVHSFGDATYFGSVPAGDLAAPIVGIASTPDGGGYWLVASDGGVFAFGDAVFHGSTGGIRLVKPMVGIAATPDGRGYWLVASDGGVFAFGDGVFQGSTGGIRLDAPVVSMLSSEDGGGYWLFASDGGVFAFGDAPFKGSTGGIHLAAPVVGAAGA